jgi:hypothetical protein
MSLLGKKINLATLLGALVIFFLPWLDMQCNGNSMVTQTGFQSVHGGGTLSEEMENLAGMGGNKDSAQKDSAKAFSEDDRPSPAWLAAGALLLIGFALILAVRGVMNAQANDLSAIALLATMALGFVALQLLLGFPLETTARQALAEAQNSDAGKNNPFAGLGAAMVRIQVIRQPVIWAELALLAVPGLLWINDAINRRNRN